MLYTTLYIKCNFNTFSSKKNNRIQKNKSKDRKNHINNRKFHNKLKIQLMNFGIHLNSLIKIQIIIVL